MNADFETNRPDTHREKVAMYESASHLQQFLVTWMLVSDGSHAQIYEYHKTLQKFPLREANKHHYCNEKSGHELVPVPNGVIEAESVDDYQIGHNQRGTASNNSPPHNTCEPHEDIKEELKQRFIRIIACKLQQACANNSFDRLVLVAQAKMIGELMEQLDADVQNRIVGVLPKDFTHYQSQAVMDHLQETVAQAHVD